MNCQKEFYILDNLRFIQLVNNLTDEQVNSLKININKTNDKYINNDCKREKAEFLTKFIDVMNDSDIPLFVREKMFEEIKKIDYDEVSVDDLKKLYMLSLSYKNQKKRRNQLIHKKMDLLDDDSKLNFEKYLMKSIYEQNNHKELNILKDEYDGENDKLSKLTPEEINKLLDFLNDDENL
ncbi:hypothetical protein [Vagococcus carniphilus]|uniref:hypothetical protein n=1 Tax=Vagococcus carniphilus TaxID=218144 RepID=UPI003BAC344F